VIHACSKKLLRRLFKLRSADRNAAVDESRIAAVAAAIDNALRSAESAHAGFSRRLEDARSRAAMVVGNGDDEYLDREAIDNQHLNALETERAVSSARRDLCGGRGEILVPTVTIGPDQHLGLAPGLA
jgi:hypothetical protein